MQLDIFTFTYYLKTHQIFLAQNVWKKNRQVPWIQWEWKIFPIFFLVGNDGAMMLPSLKQTLFVVVDLCLRSPLPQALWLRRRTLVLHFAD